MRSIALQDQSATATAIPVARLTLQRLLAPRESIEFTFAGLQAKRVFERSSRRLASSATSAPTAAHISWRSGSPSRKSFFVWPRLTRILALGQERVFGYRTRYLGLRTVRTS